MEILWKFFFLNCPFLGIAYRCKKASVGQVLFGGYGKKKPEFVEGDVFRIIVPESADKMSIYATNETKNATDETKSATDINKNAAKPELSQNEKKILSVIRKDSRITQKKINEADVWVSGKYRNKWYAKDGACQFTVKVVENFVPG